MRIFTLLLLAIMLFPGPVLASNISCELSQYQCEVGLDPTKQKIVVSGEVPKDAPVIIQLQGPDRPVLVSLLKNSSLVKFNEAEVQGIPGYYQVLTSDINSITDEKLAHPLGIIADYPQLKTDAWVRMRQDLPEAYNKHQQDYIKLAIEKKEDNRLYGIRQGVVQKEGGKYKVEIPLIEGMPLGSIKVTAMTLVNNQIVAATPQTLDIKPASFLSMGSQDASISAILVITLFMIPIILLTVAQILEFIENQREKERRAELKTNLE
ncbi:TIGR02186 family protein [Desulfotomaculum sp. 1211_IL3151]|uniref:TIGR02186 family protein n=1 Tax=Desulfotomaculum sp. 1211_IL3151 TaxID=3084055 RepID=UPI002FDA0629